jgi:hypothetical protein
LLILIRLLLLPRAALIAENLFLRKQLAFFKERKVRPGRITKAERVAMITLARFFDWRDALPLSFRFSSRNCRSSRKLVQPQPGVTPLPTGECLRRDAHLPTNLADLFAGFDLPQRVHNLLFAVPFPWHRFSSPCCPENHTRAKPSTFDLSHFRVLGHLFSSTLEC